MRYVPSALLFVAAIALYASGSSAGSALLFIAGVGCEIAAWRSALRARRT